MTFGSDLGGTARSGKFQAHLNRGGIQRPESCSYELQTVSLLGL